MTDHQIKIDTSEKLTRPRKRWHWLYVIAALAILCYLASLSVLFPTQARRQVNSQKPQKQYSPAPRDSEIDAPVDLSQLQWISPTWGTPLSLEYVPLGTQCILYLRPAELIAHSEGEKILAALGTWGERNIAKLESEVGVKFAELESLLIAIYRGSDHLDVAVRAMRNEPWADDDVQKLLNAMPAIDRTVFLPEQGQGRVLVYCSGSAAAEIARRGSEPPLLARDLERLLPFTDQDRSITVLLPGKFLNTEGRELFVAGGERLIDAFNHVVPDNAAAVMMSCDWREDFFCELAAVIIQNASAHRFNAQFTSQLAAADEKMAASLAASPPHTYGEAVEERFPAMLRTMSKFTRVSHGNGIAIARCYLPVEAGHNLLLASRLRLEADSLPTAKPGPSLTLADRLRQVTTLSLPKETLENALEILAADAELTIQIAGRDLQLEGITKNQTFTIDLRNRPAAEIVVEMLLRANPDREAVGPRDPRQKLVYVVRGDAIIVTTRAAAAQRGEELPEVFRVQEP